MIFRLIFKRNLIQKVSRISSSYTCNNFINPTAVLLGFNPDCNEKEIDNPNFRNHKRWHTGHSHHHHHDHRHLDHRHHHKDLSSGKEGERIFRLGLAADIGLATGKALTGYLSGSTAIIADAAHSISDVVLSGVALLSFKAASVPKDKEHPYGHGKFETLGALGISTMLLATAGGIAWHALDILTETWSFAPEIVNQSAHDHLHGHHHGGHHHGIDMEHPVLALNMTIISIAVKEGLFWITKRAGEKTGSGLMKANAWHHRTDAISSVVALIGVGGSFLGVRFLDPLAGLVVSGMILKAGIESGYQSILELVDAAVPSKHLEPFKHTILGVEGVKGYNRLRGRRAGSSLYVDVDIEVDPFSSVSAAHDIEHNVCGQLQQSHPEIAEVFIHVEPSTSELPTGLTDHQGDKCADHQNGNIALDQTDIEDTVSNILSSNFSEKMAVKRITRHVLQGQIFLQIEVSMPPDMLISDAMKIAEDAEKLMSESLPNTVHTSIQLRLRDQIPDLQA